MRRFRVAVLCAVVSAVALSGSGDANAASDRVLFVLAEQFNKGEFWTPYLALKAAGYRVDVAGPAKGVIAVRGDGQAHPQDGQANLALDDVNVADYVGLVIPGGYSPGNLEKHPRSIEICRAFMQADKPVAGICHGPRLLMRAGLMEGRVATCLAKVSDELADAWKAGAYGKYLDQPVVVDGRLVTSRYPGDLTAFTRAALAALESGGGLPAPRAPVQVVLVAPGLGGHEKWMMTEIPEILHVHVAFLSDGDVARFVEADDYAPGRYDLLAVLDSPGLEKLKDAAGLPKLIRDLQAKSATVLAGQKAAAVLSGMGLVDDMVQPLAGDHEVALCQLVRHALDEARGRKAPADEAAPDAALILAEGFDDAVCAAVETHLALQGRTVVRVGPKAGWMLGKAGVPFHVDAAESPVEGDAVDVGGGVSVVADAKDLLDGAKRVADSAAIAPEAARAYDAAIALRRGFDDKVVAAIRAHLKAQGKRVVLVGHEQGDLTGLNGLKVPVDVTYDEPIRLADGAVVVAPGGVWPEKTEARQATQPEWIDEQDRRDAKRLAWLLARREAGAILLAVGFDSLRLGRRPEFKGKPFACSDQTVWSFGKEGGKYSGEPARVSADRLISAKGYDFLADAIRLLGGGE